MVTVARNNETKNVAHNAATVFIVDDDTEIRRSLSLLMRSMGINVESYASAEHFLEAYDEEKPGCIILDVRMPGLSGIELQKSLKAKGVQIPIIFISAFGEIPLVSQTLRAGALDFIQKPYSSQLLLERIHEAFLHDLDNRRRRQERKELEARLARLSAREREVMSLLAEGESTKTIASRLAISPKTVDNHRAKIFEKLQVDNVAKIATLTMKHQTEKRPRVNVF